MNDQIKFSIITVCKNPGKNLIRTLESLNQQVYSPVEFILIDAASTDGTLALLDNYQHLNPKIVSEPDAGIYDAMNKGVALAQADYVYFLNAGDIFFDSTILQKVADEINKKNPDIVYGDAWIVTPDTGGGFLRRHAAVDKVYLVTNTITHQAIFARRSVFHEVGNFDTSFKRKADHDWIVRCWNKGKSFSYLPIPIVRYPDDGFSKAHRQKYIHEERKLFYRKNFSAAGIVLFKIAYKLNVLNKSNYIRYWLDKLL